MKTTTQIAEDCGLDKLCATMLDRVLDDRFPHNSENERYLQEIIGALYRRIEKLEEESLFDHLAAIGRMLGLDVRREHFVAHDATALIMTKIATNQRESVKTAAKPISAMGQLTAYDDTLAATLAEERALGKEGA